MKQIITSHTRSDNIVLQPSQRPTQLTNNRARASTGTLRHICCILLSVVAFAGFSHTAYAARIFVPELELFTRGILFDDGQLAPGISTVANLTISIEADNKIGGQIKVGHIGPLDDTIAVGNRQYNQLLNLTLISMSTGVPFDTPFYVEFFSGNHDYIGSGESFERIFNIDGIYSSFNGLQYMPINAQFQGLHQIRGTGLVFASEFDSTTFSGRWYLYREPPITNISGSSDNPTYTTVDYQPLSTDIRLMYHDNTVAADFYFGLTYRAAEITGSSPPYFLYSLRTGAMFAVGINEDIELYTYFGIPYIAITKQFTIGLPSNATDRVDFVASLSNFQFVLEPRFSLDDSFGLHFSIASKPFYYSNSLFADPGLDISARIFAGSFRPGVTRGGISVRNSFDHSFAFRGFDLIPFVGTTGGGVEWDISTNIRVIPLTVNDFTNNFSINIGARTSF